MSKILLDYVFPITQILPTPQASTAFLKQVCVVAKPKSGQEANVGDLFECTSMAQVSARTDNTNAQQLFNAGMSKVYVLLANDLDLEEMLDEHGQQFFTVLISDDFDDDDVAGARAQGTVTITNYANLVSGTADTVQVGATIFTAQSGAVTPGDATFRAATSNEATAASLASQIAAHAVAGALVDVTADGDEVLIVFKERGTGGNSTVFLYDDNDTNVGATVTGSGTLTGGTDDALAVGTFKGVVGLSNDDREFLRDQAVIENRNVFFAPPLNGAKNTFFAFGELLSNLANWTNQQYIPMPFDDGIDELGEANSLFDDKVSFVINDDEFGNRLALFAVGGRAIVAPYIVKNLQIDMQSRALQWISANQPQYTLKEASLLETRLQEDVINDYITRRKWITAGTVSISIDPNGNFVATGSIDIAEPKALWRVVSELRQTL